MDYDIELKNGLEQETEIDNNLTEINKTEIGDNFTDYENNLTEMDMFKAKALLTQITKSEKKQSWSPQQECLLKEWAEKSAGYRWLHIKSHELYNSYNNYLAYPIIVLSCIGGIGGLSIISPHKPTLFELYLQYVFFSCNIVISMLSSIQRFNRFSEEAEKHSISSIQYAKFYRNISMELSLQYEDRDLGMDFLKKCKSELDHLLTTSPEIPSKIVNKFNKTFKHVVHKPDIANGLTSLDIEHNC